MMTRSASSGWRLLSALALICGYPQLVSSHEIESDRLTIVMREPQHLSLTFRVDEVALMGHLLAPTAAPTEFVLSMAAMSDQAFASAVKQARRSFETRVKLTDQTGSPLQLRQWRWTSQDLLRAEFRERVMDSIASGGTAGHHFVSEINADAVGTTPISAVNVGLPEPMTGIVVIAYRPMQFRYDAKRRPALKIEF